MSIRIVATIRTAISGIGLRHEATRVDTACVAAMRTSTVKASRPDMRNSSGRTVAYAGESGHRVTVKL